jgi:hypothetical protein
LDGILFPTITDKYPEDEDRDGLRNVVFFTALPIDPADSPRELHHNIHLTTWRSPDGKTTNQIYHVLIDARHKSIMMDIRNYREANIDTDQYLVITRISAKINKSKYNLNKAKCVRYNVSSLQQVKDRIRKSCNEIDEEETDRGGRTKCEDIIRKAANEKIGRLRRNDRNEWFDQECAEITEEKNRKYRSMIQRRFTRPAREDYSEARRKEKMIHPPMTALIEPSSLRLWRNFKYPEKLEVWWRSL